VFLLGLHPVDIIINIINIAVLFILLRLILWKHINRFLAARAERIRSELDGAEKARNDAETLRQDYETKIEGIEAQGRDIMRDSQIKASEEAEEILKDARDKARDMLQEARERIADERERAVVKAQHEITQLAADMASRILKREVSADDNVSAVNDFFRETR